MSANLNCIVPFCDDNDNDDQIFFDLPEEAVLREIWLENIGISDCVSKEKEITGRVCRRHFTKSDLVKNNYKELEIGAVPTLKMGYDKCPPYYSRNKDVPLLNCSILNCNGSSWYSAMLQPENHEQEARWKAKCTLKPVKEEFGICALHFEKKFFLCRSLCCLTANAIPTLHMTKPNNANQDTAIESKNKSLDVKTEPKKYISDYISFRLFSIFVCLGSMFIVLVFMFGSFIYVPIDTPSVSFKIAPNLAVRYI